MRPPGIDPEAPRQVGETTTRRIEIAREQEGIVSAEIKARTKRLDHPLEDDEVELVSVVRDDDIVSAEAAELRPHVLEIRSGGDVGLPAAVHVSRLRRDASTGPDQRVEHLLHLSVPHANRRDLDDLRGSGVVTGRLEIDRREITKR